MQLRSIAGSAGSPGVNSPELESIKSVRSSSGYVSSTAWTEGDNVDLMVLNMVHFHQNFVAYWNENESAIG